MKIGVGRWFGGVAVSLAIGLALSGAAASQELVKLRLAKSVAGSIAFAGLELGQKTGIWKKHGFDVEVFTFGGDAQMQQAFVSGSIDFGLGSGPGMGFHAKGVPAVAVAALAGPPLNMSFLVRKDDNAINTGADIKGKRVGVTTIGSLTDWLARQYSLKMGWGPDGVEIVAAGGIKARLASMMSGEVPVQVSSVPSANEVVEAGEGKIVALLGEMVPDFHTHVIFASTDMVENNPQRVSEFLKAWFEIVQYMRDNRPETVKNAAQIMEVRESVIEASYDDEMHMLSDDGAFNPAAIEVIRNSFVDLGILDTVPEAKEIYTDKFVPVKR